MSYIKSHPFAVECHFKHSIVLSFSVMKEELEKLIPPCLELDLFQKKYAFIAAAFVQTENLRKAGFPSFLGMNFILSGYRIFVKYRTSEGKKLRGLFILKSETNSQIMKILGNTFTHYNYGVTDISFVNNDENYSISSAKSGFHVHASKFQEKEILPQNTVFETWKEARRFAGPLPFTFTYDENKEEVLLIEGVRSNWAPKPIEISKFHIPFIHSMNLKTARLASAFIVSDIPYKWKKGKKDPWTR